MILRGKLRFVFRAFGLNANWDYHITAVGQERGSSRRFFDKVSDDFELDLSLFDRILRLEFLRMKRDNLFSTADRLYQENCIPECRISRKRQE